MQMNGSNQFTSNNLSPGAFQNNMPKQKTKEITIHQGYKENIIDKRPKQ